MRLRVLDVAEWEASEAARYYDDQQQGLGDRFLDEYDAALERIEQNPQSFACMETVTSPREIRRCLLRGFPYVAFEVFETEAIVLAVAHGGRRPNYWIKRRA